MNVTPMDNFEVVAVHGEGVYLTDENDTYWRVAGHSSNTSSDNKLERQYAKIVSDE